MELKNGQNINLQIKTLALQGEEQASFVFEGVGQLVKMGHTLYIRYIEETENEKIPVTLKIEPDGQVQIMRGAKLHTRLKFKYQEKVAMNYRTPYGIYPMESFTRYLHFSLKDYPTSGSLELKYDLIAADQLMGSYELSLTFSA